MNSALTPNYGSPILEFDSGQGSYLYDIEGRRYLDFAMGIAVNSLGHCHPKLVAALSNQAQKLWHTSNLYRIRQSEDLAEKLVNATFADRVFFCNSGSEAIECGFKMIRRYQHLNDRPQRKRIISLTDSFHGRTLAAISAAANPAHCEGFLLGDIGFDQAEFGDIESLQQQITGETAAVIIEPIQGEGGIRIAESDYLLAVRELCTQNELMLMFDEVQCGVGRTGTLYAYEQLGVSPDVLATAKGLGGGFPIGACLATERLGVALTQGSHGSTFGGNPLATAVGNAVIDELSSEGFLESVRKNSKYFRGQLQELIDSHPALLNGVTGLGLMIGLECKIDSLKLANQLQEKDLLVVKAGRNSIRILPPLNVSPEEIDQAIAILSEVLDDLS